MNPMAISLWLASGLKAWQFTKKVLFCYFLNSNVAYTINTENGQQHCLLHRHSLGLSRNLRGRLCNEPKECLHRKLATTQCLQFTPSRVSSASTDKDFLSWRVRRTSSKTLGRCFLKSWKTKAAKTSPRRLNPLFFTITVQILVG